MGCGSSHHHVTAHDGKGAASTPPRLVTNTHAVALFKLGLLDGAAYAICDMARRPVWPLPLAQITNASVTSNAPSPTKGTTKTSSGAKRKETIMDHPELVCPVRLETRRSPLRSANDCCWKVRATEDGHVEIEYVMDDTPRSPNDSTADLRFQQADGWLLAADAATGLCALVSPAGQKLAVAPGCLQLSDSAVLTYRWQLCATAMAHFDDCFVCCLVPTLTQAPPPDACSPNSEKPDAVHSEHSTPPPPHPLQGVPSAAGGSGAGLDDSHEDAVMARGVSFRHEDTAADPARPAAADTHPSTKKKKNSDDKVPAASPDNARNEMDVVALTLSRDSGASPDHHARTSRTPTTATDIDLPTPPSLMMSSGSTAPPTAPTAPYALKVARHSMSHLNDIRAGAAIALRFISREDARACQVDAENVVRGELWSDTLHLHGTWISADNRPHGVSPAVFASPGGVSPAASPSHGLRHHHPHHGSLSLGNDGHHQPPTAAAAEAESETELAARLAQDAVAMVQRMLTDGADSPSAAASAEMPAASPTSTHILGFGRAWGHLPPPDVAVPPLPPSVSPRSVSPAPSHPHGVGSPSDAALTQQFFVVECAPIFGSGFCLLLGSKPEEPQRRLTLRASDDGTTAALVPLANLDAAARRPGPGGLGPFLWRAHRSSAIDDLAMAQSRRVGVASVASIAYPTRYLGNFDVATGTWGLTERTSRHPALGFLFSVPAACLAPSDDSELLAPPPALAGPDAALHGLPLEYCNSAGDWVPLTNDGGRSSIHAVPVGHSTVLLRLVHAQPAGSGRVHAPDLTTGPTDDADAPEPCWLRWSRPSRVGGLPWTNEECVNVAVAGLLATPEAAEELRWVLVPHGSSTRIFHLEPYGFTGTALTTSPYLSIAVAAFTANQAFRARLA